MPTPTLLDAFITALLQPVQTAAAAADRLRKLVAENARPLSLPELAIARSVYGERIPYARVVVTRLALPGGRACTTAVPTLTGVVFALNVGTNGFPGLIVSRNMRALLVHELAHVWQGVHGRTPFDYMANSLLATRIAIITTGNETNAYRYEPGAPWNSYNVEQQAQLVEDWYTSGMKTDASDKRYPYIRDSIRAS